MYCQNCGANLELKDDEFLVSPISSKPETRESNNLKLDTRIKYTSKEKHYINPTSYRVVVSSICFICAMIAFMWFPGIFIGLIITTAFLMLTVYLEKTTRGNHLYSLLICIGALIVIIGNLIWSLIEIFD